MSLPVVVRAAARVDIQEGQDWFEQQQPGLGSEFASEVLQTLERIKAMPRMYGVAWRQVRAAGVKRFGYVVYYRVHADRVEVLAVMHGRRDAREWQSRA